MTKIVLSKSSHFLGFKTEEQIRKLLCNFRRRKRTNDLLCVKHCAGHVTCILTLFLQQKIMN